MKNNYNKVQNLPNYSLAEEFILSELKNGLSKRLFYHGYHHTIDVLYAAMAIADHEKINGNDLKLLRIAVLFHDSGFLRKYDNHEECGCDMVDEYLPGFGFSPEQIKTIQGMIKATKIPHKPKNLLEKIICDADLDYLGREDVEEVASSLFEELKLQKKIADIQIWLEMQINFLNRHEYFTDFSRKAREPFKIIYLKKLMKGLIKNN